MPVPVYSRSSGLLAALANDDFTQCGVFRGGLRCQSVELLRSTLAVSLHDRSTLSRRSGCRRIRPAPGPHTHSAAPGVLSFFRAHCGLLSRGANGRCSQASHANRGREDTPDYTCLVIIDRPVSRGSASHEIRATSVGQLDDGFRSSIQNMPRMPCVRNCRLGLFWSALRAHRSTCDLRQLGLAPRLKTGPLHADLTHHTVVVP